MVFEGCATALITPFTNDEVDIASLKKIIDYELSCKVDALCVLGTTGEPCTLSDDERRIVIDLAVKQVNGRVPLIVGCGSNSTKTAIRNVKEAKELGADAVLVVTPYYNKCTQQGLIEHYTSIANSTSLPIICYNVPSRTGVNMLPSTFETLAKIENIKGLKEASGNMQQIAECIRIASTYNKAVYCGDDALSVSSMSLGAKGVISVVSNALPMLVGNMTRAIKQNDYTLAGEIQLSLLPLISLLFQETNPIPIKYCMHYLGFCQNTLRLPLTSVSKQLQSKLEVELDKLTKQIV